MGGSPTIHLDSMFDNPRARDSERLAKGSPFEEDSFAFDRPIVVSAEARIEVVGCYAPAVSARIDLIEWREGIGAPRDSMTQPMFLAVPIRVAISGYVSDPNGPLHTQLGVAAQLSLELGTSNLRNTGAERIRILFELPFWRIRLSPFVGAFVGEATGYELGMVTSVGFDGGSVLE